MTDARDIHQIEYRWHDRRDLSPVASTMSHESLRAWDSWIRPWVRHPHADRLWESVCYQVQPNGRAALAWRREDWQAAEREDGSRGRPLVSRVLVGMADLLTPEVAIALCRTGLPATAGPRPGQVTHQTRLSVVSIGELSALAREQAPELDKEAAQQEGLRQVVAAALSKPEIPLAIQIRDPYILKAPEEGLQCRLLWGLRRIVWPVLGATGRGWSFSTFEPPLGEVDSATLPDILFRQAQDAPVAALARPRQEIKVRPFDPAALEAGSQLTDMAGWLVEEYRKRGGYELKELIAKWCSGQRSLEPQLFEIYDGLRAIQSPVVVSEPSVAYVSLSADLAPEHEPDRQPVPAESGASGKHGASGETAPGPAVGEPGSGVVQVPAVGEPGGPVVQGPASGGGQAVPGHQATAPDQQVREQQTEALPATGHDPAWQSDEKQVSVRGGGWFREPGLQHPAMPVLPPPGWAQQRDDSAGQAPREGEPPPPGRWSQDQGYSAGRHQAATVADLLKRLPAAQDDQEFWSILQEILGRDALPQAERVAARRVLRREWYDQMGERRFGMLLAEGRLSIILHRIVIPDLGNSHVINMIEQWAVDGQPGVIGSLLVAARESGDDTWQSALRILQPRLAYRWMMENRMGTLWDLRLAPQYGGDSGRGFLKRKKT